MSIAKLKRLSLSLFAGYILVEAICKYIVNNIGWYTLFMVAIFVLAVWVWSEPYRNAIDG